MTLTFRELLSFHDNLPKDILLGIIKKHHFFKTWEEFNKMCYPGVELPEYIICAPVDYIDEITEECREWITNQQKLINNN